MSETVCKIQHQVLKKLPIYKGEILLRNSKPLRSEFTCSIVDILDELFGRLVELTGVNASAVLTASMSLVKASQLRGEPVLWMSSLESSFFPPDAAAFGVDLNALVIVRGEVKTLLVATERAVCSGGFGLIILDFAGIEQEHGVFFKDAVTARLMKSAQRHDAAVIFLTRKVSKIPLGSLISLRAEVELKEIACGIYELSTNVVKDKKRSLGLCIKEQYFGPHGLR